MPKDRLSRHRVWLNLPKSPMKPRGHRVPANQSSQRLQLHQLKGLKLIFLSSKKMMSQRSSIAHLPQWSCQTRLRSSSMTRAFHNSKGPTFVEDSEKSTSLNQRMNMEYHFLSENTRRSVHD